MAKTFKPKNRYFLKLIGSVDFKKYGLNKEFKSILKFLPYIEIDDANRLFSEIAENLDDEPLVFEGLGLMDNYDDEDKPLKKFKPTIYLAAEPFEITKDFKTVLVPLADDLFINLSDITMSYKKRVSEFNKIFVDDIQQNLNIPDDEMPSIPTEKEYDQGVFTTAKEKAAAAFGQPDKLVAALGGKVQATAVSKPVNDIQADESETPREPVDPNALSEPGEYEIPKVKVEDERSALINEKIDELNEDVAEVKAQADEDIFAERSKKQQILYYERDKLLESMSDDLRNTFIERSEESISQELTVIDATLKQEKYVAVEKAFKKAKRQLRTYRKQIQESATMTELVTIDSEVEAIGNAVKDHGEKIDALANQKLKKLPFILTGAAVLLLAVPAGAAGSYLLNQDQNKKTEQKVDDSLKQTNQIADEVKKSQSEASKKLTKQAEKLKKQLEDYGIEQGATSDDDDSSDDDSDESNSSSSSNDEESEDSSESSSSDEPADGADGGNADEY